MSVVKVLVEGDSSTGKSSLLVSLIAAGYQIGVWDYDNKLSSLRSFIKHFCPDKVDNLVSVPLRDRMRASENGPTLDGPPKAFSKGLSLLDKWVDGTVPAAWGESRIVVIDTLTTQSRAAYNWAKLMNSAMSYVDGVPEKGVDPRNLIYIAQQGIMNMVNLLLSDWFETNVIVMSHIKYFQREDGKTKSYPVTIGSAIAPEVPTGFPCVVQLETELKGGMTTRVLKTVSSPIIDLQNPVPFSMPKEIDVPTLTDYGDTKNLASTGLARFFQLVKENS